MTTSATTQTPAEARTRLDGLKRFRDPAVYAALAVVFLIVGFFAPDGGGHYGAWSVVAPVTLFLFVLITQRVIEGFIWGSVLAIFTHVHLDVLTGYTDTLFTQLTNADNLRLIIMLLSIGALVGVLDRSGASPAFGAWASKLARSARAARIVTLFVPLALSNDAYLATSTTGTAMAATNERFGVPRLFTAFLGRSIAVPASAFNPVATGSVFVAGLLVVNGYAQQGEEVGAYAALIPFMFFPMAIVLVAVLAAIGVIPAIGPMRRAFADPQLGVDTEAVNATADARQGRLINFFIPIAVLVAATIWLGSIQLALLITLAVTAVLYVTQRTLSPSDFVEAALSGMKDMLPLAAIMAAAFVLVAGIADLGFTEYIIGIVGTGIPAWALPVVLFLLFGLTEILVTLNWSLYLLALPIVIPLSQQLGADTNLSIAALVCAGLWGTTACLTSDIGLLNAFSNRVTVFAHWRSNLLYSLIAFVLAAVAFLAVGVMLS